ncbi:MAG: hypothetical protein AUJ34_01690 [Parcubacteria group bacterium CG1_02_41_12]|nr:MAG: hypothetical protein AUJ34_01690 [Parcubacteria group bacterium CG1_02_41_12]
MTKSFKPYYNAVAYLECLASSSHDTAYMKTHSAHPEQYVERTREFINRLGRPDQGFRFIHVAGTSGKGSTVAYLHKILHKAGYRVGSFTSPYCTTSIEKIKVNDKFIDPIVFACLTDKVKPVIADMDKTYKYGRPSYFEIFFGLSLLYFKKIKCDFVILEVGCGGRYDAGNIIETSISAITNIGLDHTHLLGKTLPKIAKEKAGIIKPNTHLFTTEQRDSILKIFKTICKQKHTTFHKVLPSAKVAPSLISPLVLRGGLRGGCVDDGKFQSANQALASAIAKHLNIKNDIIDHAIKTTELPPCRFEIMQKNPLVILDGAHNPDKIKSVVHNLKHLTCATLYTIFAASDTKDAKEMLRILLPHTDEIIFTKFKTSNRDSFTPEQLSKFAGKFKNKSIEHNSLKALKQTITKLRPQDALLITGSLYLTGELRKYWISENKILINRETCQTS